VDKCAFLIGSERCWK